VDRTTRVHLLTAMSESRRRSSSRHLPLLRIRPCAHRGAFSQPNLKFLTHKFQSFTVIYDFGIWVALLLGVERKRIGGWSWHR